MDEIKKEIEDLEKNKKIIEDRIDWLKHQLKGQEQIEAFDLILKLLTEHRLGGVVGTEEFYINNHLKQTYKIEMTNPIIEKGWKQ